MITGQANSKESDSTTGYDGLQKINWCYNMPIMSKRSERKKASQPRTFTQRITPPAPPKESYLLIGKQGSVRPVSKLDFVVAEQFKKIMHDRVPKSQGILQESAGVDQPDADRVEPMTDAVSNLTAPSMLGELREEQRFLGVRPVTLTPEAVLFLELTAQGCMLPADLRNELIVRGDSAQVEYAVIEGLRMAFEQSRLDLGLPLSRE